MSADERSPLLPASREDSASETTRLLRNALNSHAENEERHNAARQAKLRAWLPWARPSKDKDQPKQKSSWRWPSIIAMTVLAIFVVLIIILGFLIPPTVQKYAEKAAVLEPTNLSIESINSDGVRARVQANVRLDASRVDDSNARRIGKLVTGIMRRVETKETKVNVYLPDYDNALFGSAILPPLVVDIINGHTTEMDFVTDLSPGDAENIRKIANDWLKGNLKQLKLTGKAKVDIKSGIFPLGAHKVAESMVFEAKNGSSLPEYKIERLNFHDVPVNGDDRKAVAADVSISVRNDYPISLNVPPLGFEVLVPNCDPSEPSIVVAEATTSLIEIHPEADVMANAKGVVKEIPESLTRACPHSQSSPLDRFMEHYLKGDDAKVFVRGRSVQDSDLPEWIGEILKSITVPVEFPGRSFDNLIRNFSLSDVNFQLPDPFAEPDDPSSQPRVSGSAEVLAALPPEFNLDLGVDSLRATADLFFEERKLGELNLDRWQEANSTRLEAVGGGQDLLNITSKVVDAPINITDGDVFSDVMQKMLFGDDDVILDVDAAVDVKISTVLGLLSVKNVPARGKLPVKRLPGNILTKLQPQLGHIEILNTSDTGIQMQALVNITNPTSYTAVIPYLNIHILHEGHLLGDATAEHLDLKLGNNTNVSFRATWDPKSYGGKRARRMGRKLLSDFVSGKNTTMTARAHRESIPTMPVFGEALSKLNFTVPMPRIGLPGDSETNQRFIKDATFHLFSSSANFGLISPLEHNTMYIEYINATAFYNHTEPVGQIVHDDMFPVPPGFSETPRLPVYWSPSHVGYDKLWKALGGELKLDAVADVTVRVGNWVEKVHYTGKGIGAKVTL